MATTALCADQVWDNGRTGGFDAGSNETVSYTIDGYLRVGVNSFGGYETNGSVQPTITQDVIMAQNQGSTGVYSQSGNGKLTAQNIAVGAGGEGTFNQSGGTVITNDVGLGAQWRYDAASNSSSSNGGSSTSSGTYNLNGGTLQAMQLLGNSFTAGSRSTFNFNGGTVLPVFNGTGYDGYAFRFAQYINLLQIRGGGARFDVESLNISLTLPLVHSTISGDAATDGGLTKLGPGLMVLTANNTYTGTTTLNGGVLQAGSATALGNGGSISFNGGILQYGTGVTTDFSPRFAVTMDPQFYAIDTNGNNVTFVTDLSSQGGSLTKTGAGTLSLGGSTANTFTGLTSVTAGTLNLAKSGNVLAVGGALSIGNATSPGAADSVVAHLGDNFQTGTGTNVSVYADGLFDVDSRSTNVGTLSMNGGEVRIGAGSLGLNANLNVYVSNSNSQITSTDFKNDLNLNGGTRTFTVFSGLRTYDLDVQAGVGGGTLVKAGTGTLRLAGVTNNNLSVTLNAGILALAADGALGTSGGTFTLAGGRVVADGGDRTLSNPVNVTGSATVGGSVETGSPARALSLTGAMTLGTGAVLTVSNTAATTISGVVSGAGGLTKSGSGTLTLSGANTFTGSTTINAGTLAISGSVASGSGASLVVDGNSGAAATLSLSGTGSLSLGTAYVGYNGTGTFTQSGGSFNTNGQNLFVSYNAGSRGTYNLSGGTLTTGRTQIGDDANSPAVFTQTGGLHTTGTLGITGYSTGAQGTYTLAGGVLNVGSVTNNNGNSSTTGTSTFHFAGGTLQANTGTASFLQGLTTADVQGNGGAKIDTNGFNVTVAQSLASGTASGTADGGLTKSGGGTLMLTGNNTYTGPTNITVGTLTVSNDNGSAPGRLANTSAIVINNGGTLLLSGSTAVSDRLNNAATVTLNGGGKLLTGGLNEGTRPTAAGGSGGAVGVGALTLASTSASSLATIDFGSTQTGSTLVFSSLSAGSKSAYVSVLGFTGTNGDNGAATNDRLLFTSDPGFTTADLTHWQFYNDAGTAFATGGVQIAYNGYFEIVPVPEPATWLAGTLLIMAAGLTLRRQCGDRRAA